MTAIPFLDVHPEVAAALAAKRPVVALESTIIAHGMPYPNNVATALQVEAAAFAWLARQTCQRQTASLPKVTGAQGARILGAIYPA